VSDPLKRLDRAVYNVERTIVVTALVVMSIVVFLDVVHRTFSGEGSKLASAIAKIAGMMGRPIPEESEQFQSLVDVSPYIVAVVSVVLGYAGVRTARRAEPIAPPRALVLAVGGVVVVYGLIRLLVVMMPNGFIWSQPLALLLTLWVGFVGASMCTYENKHLKVEAVQRVLPPKIKPLVGFASGVATALVCLFLLWVSLRYVMFNYQEYVDTEGKGGLFQGMDVPKYVGFLALPASFFVMSARFLGKAFAALRGEIDDDPTGGLLAVAKSIEAPRDDDEDTRAPSDVETEAVPSTGPRQSEIDTVSSGDRLRPEGTPRPSQISTQPHPVEQASGRRAGARASAGQLGQPPMGSSRSGEMGKTAGEVREAAAAAEASSDDATATEEEARTKTDGPALAADDDEPRDDDSISSEDLARIRAGESELPESAPAAAPPETKASASPKRFAPPKASPASGGDEEDA
jgi:TRAP-type C4-dicarboxylate transport system permease small subunit